MSNINDYKLASLRTQLSVSAGHINDLELQYLQANGATANNVPDAWYQLFVLNGATSLNWNDAAMQFLVALGATGDNLQDNWAWFWITNGGVITPPYDPGMMTFSSSTYSLVSSFTTAGNLVTGIIRLNRAAFSGGGLETAARILAGGYNRMAIYVISNDYATADLRSKVACVVTNSSGTNICNVATTTDVCDGVDHLIFFAFDASTGAVQLYLDGADDENGSYSGRTLTTGTLPTSASSTAWVGGFNVSQYYGGEIGYFGHREAYLTNPTDFYHPTNGLQELDESGWTEWGAQPLFWNQYGQMTDNKGSAGNMVGNGSISGPA